MLSIKVVNGNLVTKRKRVWISCDNDGWYKIWRHCPRCLRNMIYVSAESQDTWAGALEVALTSEVLCWFKANIKNTANGPLLNALPGPGDLWEVKLI